MLLSLNWLTIPLLAIIPALGWTLLYRYLDHREAEPQDAVLFAVIAGMCSTIPVFALQRFFVNYPDFNLLSLLQTWMSSELITSALFLVFVAVLEELVKAIALIVAVRRFEWAFTQVVDGIVYGAMVGLGFAITENMYYFFRAVESFQYTSNFLAVIGIRSFGTMLAHTLFTGLFGFFYAKAYFDPFISKQKAKPKRQRLWHRIHRKVSKAIRLHSTFFHLLPERKQVRHQRSKRHAMVVEGFFFAVLLHFLYNGFIKLEIFGRHWTVLMIPLIFVASWYLWSQFFVPLYIRIIHFVRVKRELQVRIR